MSQDDPVEEKMEKFWDTCDKNFAHIELDRHLPGYEKLCVKWEQSFCKFLDFEGKTVVDYGIGGGYLGKYLFQKRGLKKYIGYDISQRSLNKAKENLEDYKNTSFLLKCNNFYKNPKTADIFISQACIQHFPNEDYLNKFLNTVNNKKYRTVMLQFRHAPKTRFNQGDLMKENVVVMKCHTNAEYILNIMSNYKLIYKSPIEPNHYQFCIFELK